MPRGDGGAGARAAASLQYCGEIVGSFFPVCSRCRRMEQTFLCLSEYDGERLLNCHSFTAYLLPRYIHPQSAWHASSLPFECTALLRNPAAHTPCSRCGQPAKLSAEDAEIMAVEREAMAYDVMIVGAGYVDPLPNPVSSLPSPPTPSPFSSTSPSPITIPRLPRHPLTLHGTGWDIWGTGRRGSRQLSESSSCACRQELSSPLVSWRKLAKLVRSDRISEITADRCARACRWLLLLVGMLSVLPETLPFSSEVVSSVKTMTHAHLTCNLLCRGSHSVWQRV